MHPVFFRQARPTSIGQKFVEIRVRAEPCGSHHPAYGLSKDSTSNPFSEVGADEAVAVETWFKSQTGQGWRVAKYQMLGTLKPAPFLVLGGKP
jgi:hypothetical protein